VSRLAGSPFSPSDFRKPLVVLAWRVFAVITAANLWLASTLLPDPLI
jgi:hypothetical protein